MNVSKRILLAIALTGVSLPGIALAEQVMPMPFSQKTPALPHPAHEGARITLKAMVRDAGCGSGYDFTWNTNRNDTYNDDWTGRAGREGHSNSVRHITRTFTVPDVDEDTSYNIDVRVVSRCNGEEFFGTFRLFIFDWRPSADPRNWTREQLEIMASMAAQESMWYLHRQLRDIREQGNRMYGRDADEPTTGLTAWLMIINGHMPAYPPNTIQWHGIPEPEGFDEANDQRWNTDPLAESVVRRLNYVTSSGNTRGIPGGEESNQNGYDAQQRPTTTDRLAGTTDNRGAYARHSHNTYRHGLNLGALAPALAVLADTPVQRGGGGIQGRLWQWYIQQFVDLMGAQQIDGGRGNCSNGGWLYSDFNGGGSCGHSDGSTTQWAYIGLESAAVAGEASGVFVNNRHKYRIANNLIRGQRGGNPAHGTGYRNSSGRGDLKLTGGALVGARWLGLHTFNINDGVVPFPGESDFTRGRLRLTYDRAIAFTVATWTEHRSVGSHWADSMWEFGDYLCGNRNAIHNVRPRCGSTYGMYSHQKGYRTGSPELELVGGRRDRDWYQQFTTYYVRAMDKDIDPNHPGRYVGFASNDEFGQIKDDYCANHSVTCVYGRGGSMSSSMGGLLLTPTIFKPKPVAIAVANPDEVTAGCAGGNNGRVTFDHSASFHPSDADRIVVFRWDVDASNGLWWETGAPPDYNGAGDGPGSFVYTYQRAGAYTATLEVVDTGSQSNRKTVTVRVNEAENVPPSALHGGPYIVEENANLQLRGRVTDNNIGCGDRVTTAWDIDGDGFDDGDGATPVIPWARLDGFERGQAHPIRIRVVDEAGEEDIAQTTFTIYPRNPIAVARANPPNPVACPTEVVFDGSRSSHPNPDRSIAQYAWDIGADGQFDGNEENFRHEFTEWGDVDVVLRVTDDLGRSHSTQITVEVSAGNQPPVARVSSNNYVVLEGENLVLNAQGSSEPNEECGDEIVSYEWDLDGDGQFGGDDDVNGVRPQVAWADVARILDGPADRDSGEPFNTVTLRVTDTRGLTATVQTRVTWFSALPIAAVVQNPNPSPISLRNGFSRTVLDGRESRSPVPGGEIDIYAWDLDDDGNFEIANRPTVEFLKVFNPVPNQQNIPDVFIRLRVTDADGRVSQVERYQVQYDVPPTDPTADADPTDPPEQGYHILLGEDLELDGSQSDDPDIEEFDDYLQFVRWDCTYDEDDGFNADFETEDANGDNQEQVVLKTLDADDMAGCGLGEPGEYTVAIQVEDSTELRSVDTAPLFIYPVNPIASATANPNPSACRERVTLDGRASDHQHPGVDITGYTWDIDGDGQYDDANGAVVNHAFQTFGTHDVGLRVTDSNGNAGTTTVEVRVTEGNRAPVAVAGGFRNADDQVVGPYAIAVGEALQLDGLGTLDPDANCGDAVVNFQWDIGNDGTFDIQGADARRPAAVAWAALDGFGIDRPGNFEVRLRATDRAGATSESIATVRVVVGPTARVNADPERAGCEQQVLFSGSQSSTDGPVNQGFEIVEYLWDFDGDGEYDDGEGRELRRPVAALPDENGRITFTGSLRVVDASGRTDEDDVVIVIDVQNLRPTADAGGPYATGRINGGFADVRLDARGSSDPNQPCDEIALVKWDTDGDGLFGADDNPADLVGMQVDYNNPNWRVNLTQTVRVIVCDAADACSNPDEADINVGDEAPPSGEILSPRDGEDEPCLAAGNFNVVANVSDPEGDNITVTVVINGREVGERQVDTPDNGDSVEVTVPVNANLVAEGEHVIIIELDDGNGGEAEANSGGRITFDRTAPEVVIGDRPGDGVCYVPGQVPDANAEAEDNIDQSPELASALEEEGCARTLVFTATDACGNEGTARRLYRLAIQPEIDINGADEGELVAEARMSWDVIGGEECAPNISATVSRNGGGAVDYQEGSLINEGGDYTLTIEAGNCQGVTRDIIRNFSVNVDPTAIPIPNDHPQAHPDIDPDAQDERDRFHYAVNEGDGLQLDGRDSLAPEDEGDQIESWNWDFADDNLDVEGELAAFDTSEDGVFDGTLIVADSLGASDRANFRITVADVDPTANPGGPYVVDQGADLRLDGRGSTAGSNADAIRLYRWDWGHDNASDEGADLNRPTHSWPANGNFNVTLTVFDEDSEDQAVVRVEVRDVDPVIESIDAPEDPYEIRPMEFHANATAGAPGDPITRYEWDFNNDGEVDYEGAGDEFATATYQFIDAGQKTVSVRVRDRDSDSVLAINVNVRPITLGELLTWIGERIEGVLADGRFNLAQKLPLNGAMTFVNNGVWAEEADPRRRGTALVATDKLIGRLGQAQSRGVDFAIENWALARTLKREVENLRDAIEGENGANPDADAFERGEDFIGEVADRFNADGFRADAGSDNRFGVVQEVWSDAFEAYFHLRDSVEVYNNHNRYRLPNRDPVEASAAGDIINTAVVDILEDLQADLQAYVDAGNDDIGPGRSQVSDAIQVLESMRALQAKRVINPCPPDEECVTDQEALEMEILAMDLVRALDAAANAGAFSRIWQQHLVLLLKFRIELSLLRVEFLCGRFNRYAQLARERQTAGLEMVDDGDNAAALAFYVDNDTRCLMIETYNGCIVPAEPEADEVDVPDECAEEEPAN